MHADYQEEALVFGCRDERLVGILHHGTADADTGLIIVTGGPQYRVGSHRQFVLLARRVASAGYPVLRFDYRGMGDSSGSFAGFEDIGDDIRAAVDACFDHSPNLKRVMLWGLCDAASAAMIYAPTDKRISGLILLNPWARTESGEAKALISHYYMRRVISADFWRSLARGRVRPLQALRSLAQNLKRMLWDGDAQARSSNGSFITRMESGLTAFEGRVLFIISGNDLTAAEFIDLTNGSGPWQRLLHRQDTIRKYLENADHTFSTDAWRRQVEDWTLEWVRAM